MILRRSFVAAVALAAIIVAPSVVRAQRDSVRVALGDRAPRPAGPRTIAGIVVDTGGVGLDSIDVYITSLRRRVLSRENGTFRFDSIKPGKYDVTARRIGYFPQVQTVAVDKDGGVVIFALVPTPRVLAPVVTVSSRGGLSGVVGDTAYNALAGAEISILASSYRTVADSTGAFYMPVRPGTYFVRVTHEGFVSRMTSVTVPPDSGRRIMVWLAPPGPNASPRDEFNVLALQERLAWRTALAKILTREDLLKTSMTELTQLVGAATAIRVDDSCSVILDGGPHRVQMWELHKEDIESIEVYPGNSLPNPSRPLRGNQLRGNLGGDPTGASKCVTTYVWLRK